jgi:hypothetical protein
MGCLYYPRHKLRPHAPFALWINPKRPPRRLDFIGDPHLKCCTFGPRHLLVVRSKSRSIILISFLLPKARMDKAVTFALSGFDQPCPASQQDRARFGP